MTTDIATDPWAAQPDYVALVRAQQRIASLTFPMPVSVVDAQRAVLERLISGEELDGRQVVEEMARAQLGAQPVEAAHNMRVNAIHELRNRLAMFQHQHRDAALAWLNERMGEVFGRVLPLAAGLSDIASAEEAMRAGDRAVKAWAALSELVGTYRALRAQQHEIVAGSYDHAPQARVEIARFGTVRESRQYPPLTDEVAGAEPTLHFDPAHGDSWRDAEQLWPTDDDRAFLLWCAHNNATPWIPTVKQLRAELEAHRDDVRQAAEDREHPDRAARRRAAAVAEAKAHRRINALLAEADARATMAAADPLYAARMAKL